MNKPKQLEIQPSPQPLALRVAANIFTYVFHPVFMPVLLTFAIYKFVPVAFAGVSPKEFYKWLGIIAFLTIFFPLVTLLLMKALGFIKTFTMHDARERVAPLMAVMIYYFWVSHVFDSLNTLQGNTTQVPLILKVWLLGNFYAVIAIFTINIFFKISMHATAAGGVIGIVFVLMMASPANMMIPLFAAIVLAGLIGTARMILGSHIMFEIWLGYMVGVIVQLLAYWYLK